VYVAAIGPIAEVLMRRAPDPTPTPTS
jgi:hypothetical protein